MKYLTNDELKTLSDSDLDKYAIEMTNHQFKILAAIEEWSNVYNMIKDEYSIRKPVRYTVVNNDSTTKH